MTKATREDVAHVINSERGLATAFVLLFPRIELK